MLDEIARAKSALAGVEITRSDVLRLAADQGARHMLAPQQAPQTAAVVPVAPDVSTVPVAPDVSTAAPSAREAVRDISSLAESFPSLRGRPGVRPWNKVAMLHFYRQTAQTEQPDDWFQIISALQFMKSIGALQLGQNDLEGLTKVQVREAKRLANRAETFSLHNVDSMDREHRAAVAAWMLDPWFPGGVLGFFTL